MTIKTVNLSIDNWKEINVIRLNQNFKTMDDVISFLIDYFIAKENEM